MSRKHKFINRITEQIAILFLPIVMIFLLGPMEIWAGNSTDLPFLWGDFFYIFLLASFVFLLVGVLILSIMPEKVQSFIDMLIFTGSILCYCQVMFLNVKLVADNGGKMQWHTIKGITIANTFIWIVVFVLIFAIWCRKKKMAKKIFMYISVFLELIQAIALLFMIVMNIEAGGKVQEMYWFNGQEQFKVAEGNNVILFVLDSFGSAQLEMGIEQDENCLDGMKDFTYYNNADPVYYRTMPSMTHILTGVDYDTDMTARTWMNYAWNNDRVDSYYEKLHNDGYGCFLYSDNLNYTYSTGNNLVGKFNNIKKSKAEICNRNWLFSKMLKLSIYRYSPYIIKPYFEVLTSEFSLLMVHSESSQDNVYDMAQFLEALEINKLSFMDDYENAIIVQHLRGTHAPLNINEYGMNVTEDETDYGKTVRGNLNIMYKYFDYLRQIDKYDDSTIIITADHGEWILDDKMDLQVIFFMKEKNETHDKIQVSSAPISHCDILPTIYDALGYDYDDYGTSVNDWSENDCRERVLYNLNDDVLQGWTYISKEELYKRGGENPDIYIETDMY